MEIENVKTSNVFRKSMLLSLSIAKQFERLARKMKVEARRRGLVVRVKIHVH
jgi:hypothetical protein